MVGAGHAEAAVESALEDGGHRGARGRVVAEALGAAPDGVTPVEVAADDDVQAGAGGPAGLLGELQAPAVDNDGVVRGDDTLLFHAQDLIEIDIAEGDEGRGWIGRGPGEGGVVVGDEVFPQIRVGGLRGGEAGQAEFVDEAVLQGAMEARPGRGLGGSRRRCARRRGGRGRGRRG